MPLKKPEAAPLGRIAEHGERAGEHQHRLRAERAHLFEQCMRGREVAAHAEVEVGLAFAAHRGGQVEDGIGLAPGRGVGIGGELRVQVAGDGADASIGCEVGRRGSAVDQRDAFDGASRCAGQREAALLQQRAGEACAQKAGAAGDDDVHGSCLL